MKSDTKVFLPERPNRELDLRKAQAYGELSYFFDQNERRAGIFQTERFCADLAGSFSRKGFRPKQDYLCLAGSLIVVSMTLALLVALYGEVKVLLYNAESEEYIDRVISAQEYLNKGQKNGWTDDDPKAD